MQSKLRRKVKLGRLSYFSRRQKNCFLCTCVSAWFSVLEIEHNFLLIQEMELHIESMQTTMT